MKRIILFLILFLSVIFGQSTNVFDYAQSVDLATRKDDGLTNVGLAPFAIAHRRFQCKKFLQAVDQLDYLHIAWLYHTFGKKYGCLRTLMHDPRLETLETNLINEPGHRNRRLEKHEFLYGISSPQKYDRLLKSRNKKLRKKFFKYVAPLQKLLADNLQPHTQCLINPGLESNVSDRAGKVLVEWTREAFPNCRIVWNPLKAAPGRREKAKADLIEGHGHTPNVKAPCLTNLDGTDISFPQRKSNAEKNYTIGHKNWINSGASLQQHLEAYANRCEVAFLWVAEFNCIDPNLRPGGFEPPLKRKCVTGRIHELVANEAKRAHRNGKRHPVKFMWDEVDESSFQGCTAIRKPADGSKKGFLLKQSEFSDRGGVVIAPIKASNAKIIHRGRVIDTYKFQGRYHSEPRYLYRSNKTPLKYPFKVAVKFSNGICYRVNNPRVRND